MRENNLRKRRNKSIGERLDAEVEKVVYKVMTNSGLEETVALAIQKGLMALVRRYLFLIVIGVTFLLAFQSIIIAITFKMLID